MIRNVAQRDAHAPTHGRRMTPAHPHARPGDPGRAGLPAPLAASGQTGSVLGQSLWRLLSQPVPIEPALVRLLCSVMFIGYGLLWLERCLRLGFVEEPLPRLAVLGSGLVGIVVGPRLGIGMLRVFALTVTVLMSLATFYVTAIEGYPPDRLPICVLTIVVALMFLLSARDLVLAQALLIGGHWLLMWALPPAGPPSAIWSQLSGALGVGTAAGLFVLGARAVLYESLRRLRITYERERLLRALAESAASTVALPPLLRLLARRFQETLPGSLAALVLSGGDELRVEVALDAGGEPIESLSGKPPPPLLRALYEPAGTSADASPRLDLSPAEVDALGGAQGLPFVPRGAVVLALPSLVPGMIVLLSPGPVDLHPDLDDTWRSMANHAGVAITNARAVQQLREQEARTRRLSEERAQVAELRARFVAQASHEFRTPLAVILAAADAMRRYDARLTPTQRLERLAKIRTAVGQMTDLLDDVLAFGRADTGRLACARQRLDVLPLCSEVLADIRAAAQSTHEILLSSADGLLVADVDPKLLRRILENLLSNAVKYSPGGGTVRLEVAEEENTVVFRVIDQGLGILPQDQGHLFEPFHRGTNVGKIPGSGLGLAITEKAVESHGGDITVQSRVGEGTTFVVRLPKTAPGAGAQASPDLGTGLEAEVARMPGHGSGI